MLFNSIDFAIFLPLVFISFWFLFRRNLRSQNLLLLAASYLFYGWWDWRFLSLIAISSVVDYFIGIHLFESREKRRRKLLLFMSLAVNLGFLGFFKYFNFFMDGFSDLSTMLGLQVNTRSLNVILPVGISFYTFQTLSYSIDIYRKQMEPTRDLIAFLAFVSFFPQLVAGPIERAKNLLPQFHSLREFNLKAARNGLQQILWGLFKKIVIADTCARQVDSIFANYADLDGSVLLLGAIFFAFQIYGDFSGYSDIAIGTAKLFGFDLMRNFAFPYFSRDIGEFWRRWHISLSTWFRDYLYIPLGGSYGSKARRIGNILITFTVSGFWHGANWTFIFWGFLNGLYYIPLMLRNKQKENKREIVEGKFFPSLRDGFNIALTFLATIVAWVFFRAESLTHAFGYLMGMFSPTLFKFPSVGRSVIPIVVLFVIVEWFNRRKQHVLEDLRIPQFIRWPVYYTLTIMILYFWQGEQSFIYFQF